MSQELHQSTQDLINQIERKDRRFRLFQSVFIILLMLGLIAVIYIQFQTLSAVKQQLENDATTTQEAREARDNQLERIERRLNCIVFYYTQAERGSITIENIDKCTLNKNSVSFDGPPSTQTSPSDEGANTTPPSSSGTAAIVPQEPNTDENPNSETPPAEERPPATLNVPLIDISPVCLPLVSVCLE